MNNKQLGNAGEDLACKYLENNGYKIIARNVRYSTTCEIDIIAQIKNTTVFVEVKTRKTDSFGTPIEAITKTKYEHIKKGIIEYLKTNKVKKYRIDIVGITLKPDIKIEHFRNYSLQ